ncbi:IclR family transcriptional regulator [uncultured Martelella sp.]|uniref:IclR family transcriptional regulator n=1 Tax=uncultured Martelella sp. TaxID=392331 RepID=UPI0029C96423|nr:IclR family transcriptional regulator [uncultured Martelella sp.]
MATKYQVPALIRAKQILDLLGEDDADLQTIVSKTGLAKSSVYTLLQTLEEIGFVRRLQGGSRFALGFGLFEMGTLAVSKVSIRDHAIAHLRELSFKERVTCHLGALDGNEAVYLLKVDPQDSILINSWEGKRLSLHRSAMGKILLAWLADARRNELLATMDFSSATTHTIIDRIVFEKHLKVVKARKWAMDDEEDIAGIRCLAVPIFSSDRSVHYSLSLSSMASRIPDERIDELCAGLLTTAQRISQELGAPNDVWTPN